MKAVFCCLNSKYIHSSLAPWCLFASCKKHCCEGVDVSVNESTINEETEIITERLLKQKADVLSFSCYIWNIKKVLLAAQSVKAASPDTLIVLGGPEVSFCPGEMLENNPFVDFVVAGEGEKSIPELLNSIYLKNEVNIKGVSFRKGEEIVQSPLLSEVYEEKISPYCKEYFAALQGRIAYIESSRGCPFGCAFCLSGRIGKVRYFDLEQVKDEMVHLCAMGAKTVKFVDRTFNCHKGRAKEILQFICQHYGFSIPEGVCFHFEIAADLLDDELFEVIEKLPAGSVQFEIGIQSFNESTLKAINRKTDLVKVTENVKKLLAFGNCHVHIDLIAGLPGESYDSFIDGFNKAYKIGAHMLQLGFLKILKGSPMDENRKDYPCQYSPEPPYEVISTPYISDEELLKLHIAENELERLYNSGRFLSTLDYVLSVTKLKPYELFYSVGEHLKKEGHKGSIPLDKYVNIMYMYFSSLEGVDSEILRDKMIYDRLSTNSSDVIPEKLKRYDPRLKKIKRELNDLHPPKHGAVRSVAVLYGRGSVIYCDYDKKHPVTGRYTVMEYNNLTATEHA